jgi:molybdopterin converting factor small subunit
MPDCTTLADLIRHLEVDEQLVCLVAVNGRVAEAATVLEDGDLVDLIPPITGGAPGISEG